MAGTGQRRGRRGIIGGYWGGYSLLSLSPTPRALPGKVENLTPPANGKNAPDGAPPAQAVPCWNVASWSRCARISASDSSPAPERGTDPAAHDMHRDAPGAADRTASADRRPEQQRTTRRLPWPFSFAPPSRLRPARSAGSVARHALGVAPPRGKAGKCPGSAGRSAWILRPPPAPGRISTASAATDDPASSRPPPTMTKHQRQPCPTCTAPTACQSCQTSQQQRQPPAGRTSPPAPPNCRRLHRCRLPDDPPRRTPQNGHFAPPPEGSDSPPNGIEL